MADKLRMEQYKNEPVDLFVLRVLSRALPQIQGPEREAMWSYLRERAVAELTPRITYDPRSIESLLRGGDGESK